MGSRLPLAYADVVDLSAGAGWKGWQIVTAVAVAKAESNHDGYAVGVVGAPERAKADGTGNEPNPAYRSLDVGLFQVNTYWHTVTVADMLDPGKNAAKAYALWRGRWDAAPGTWADKTHAAWSQWAVFKSGAHEQYLGAAVDACRAAGIAV